MKKLIVVPLLVVSLVLTLAVVSVKSTPKAHKPDCHSSIHGGGGRLSVMHAITGRQGCSLAYKPAAADVRLVRLFNFSRFILGMRGLTQDQALWVLASPNGYDVALNELVVSPREDIAFGTCHRTVAHVAVKGDISQAELAKLDLPVKWCFHRGPFGFGSYVSLLETPHVEKSVTVLGNLEGWEYHDGGWEEHSSPNSGIHEAVMVPFQDTFMGWHIESCELVVRVDISNTGNAHMSHRGSHC